MRIYPTNVFCFSCKQNVNSFELKSGACKCGLTFSDNSVAGMLRAAGHLHDQTQPQSKPEPSEEKPENK